MAIFGDLADLPFPDIFNVFDQRSGRLLIFGIPDQGRFELDLADGMLRGLRIDGRDIDDPLRVRDRLTALMRTSGGFFEFHRSPPGHLRGALDLPIACLVMHLASAVDELGAYRGRFPHPRTLFKPMPGAEAPHDAHLRQFLERATAFLRRGADAEELSNELGVSLEHVQLSLYKLRAAGVIAPAHLVEESGHGMPEPGRTAAA